MEYVIVPGRKGTVMKRIITFDKKVRLIIFNIDKVEFVDYSLIPAYVEVYMIVLLVFLGLWILIDAMLDTWESEHQILISHN